MASSYGFPLLTFPFFLPTVAIGEKMTTSFTPVGSGETVQC